MVRSVLAVIAGLAAGVLVVGICEMPAHVLYPVPNDVDVTDRAQLQEHISNLPAQALLMVLGAHFVGTFCGGAVSGLVARRRSGRLAAIIGGFFLVAGLINLFFIPHPAWFGMADILIYLPAAWFGMACYTKPTKVTALAEDSGSADSAAEITEPTGDQRPQS